MTKEQEWRAAESRFYPARDEAWASNRDVRAAEDAVEAARANWRDERDEAALVAAKEALAAAKQRSEDLWARSDELCVEATRAYRRWVEEREAAEVAP